MIEFCELSGLCRRLIRRALCSARKMQYFGRLNVEISQSGRKLQSFFVEIDECSSFASRRACFDAKYGVHYVLRVKCSNLIV
jgi:hypothetical protein